jgi:hypothetical protein
MPLYNDLPGIELTVKDGNLVLPAEPAPTQTVLIIGPASEEGEPTGETVDCTPKRVTESSDFAKHTLGVFNKSNPLARAWKQVHDAGCRSIYCLRLKGQTAEQRYANLHTILSVLEDNFRTDIIYYAGIKADTAINTSQVALTGPRADYSATTAAQKTEKALETFDESDGKELVLTSPFYPDLADTAVVKKVVGGDETTLEINKDYTVDIENKKIVLAENIGEGETVTVEYPTYYYSFPDQLAGFCAAVSEKNNQVIGVLGLKPPSAKDLATIKAYVDEQKTQKYNQYLQIVGGATLFFEIGNEPYEDDFSAAYAGLISYLPSYSSPTNKAIPGVLFPAFNLSPAQIKALTNKHIVVPRLRNGRVIISDAITTAADNSDFVRLTTVRIVNDAVNLVREIAEPYIGEANSLARMNALETALNSGLKAMINRGALNDYRLVIKASLADQIEGNMRIALDLVPVFETRRIFVTVALKPTLD